MANLQRGFVYLVFVDSGRIKVGMSRNSPSSRIDAARRIVEKDGFKVIGSWVSPQIMNRYETENKLIARFDSDGDNVSSMGREWFDGIDATYAIDYAESILVCCPAEMPILKPLEQKRNLRITDEHWTAFKELLGVDWLKGQINKAIAKEQKKAVPLVSDK